MTRIQFIVMVAAIAVLAFAGMWIAWRARARRDSAVAATATELVGDIIDAFPRASYVSTTVAGVPFERVAVPGLRYTGFAEVIVRRDGVSIQVNGENAVTIAQAQLLGSGTAGGRIGKIVERDGLSVLVWSPAPGEAPAQEQQHRELESSFRLADPAEQHRFNAAIQAIIDPAAAATGDTASAAQRTTQIFNSSPTTQEDA